MVTDENSSNRIRIRIC